jgi:hypothetical protein
MNRTTLRSLIAPTLGWIALLIAASAQYLHVVHHADEVALGLFIAAGAWWLWAILSHRVDLGTRLNEASVPATSPRAIPPSLIVSVILLTGLTFLFSGGNEFNPDNVLAWALSIGVFLYAFWEPEKNWEAWRGTWTQFKTSAHDFWTNGIRLSPHLLALFGILLIGVFFYYHDLDGVPAEMTSDHAEKLLDVNDIVTKGLRPIFLERNTGREPLQFYLTAAFIGLTGHPIDHMALKLITAALGVLVIPFTFLFVRELFDDEVALLTALFIAFSKWPLTIARMGLRFPLTPVFIAPLMFFLLRALKYQRRNDFLMAGIVLGIGLYGYNAFRVAPILVGVFLLLWPLLVRPLDREQLRRYVVNSVLMFALMLVILMPLLRYMSEHPGNFWYRIATRLTDVESPIKENPVQVFAGNLVNASLMFNWTGDEAWPNSIPDDPALDYVTGALFLLGAVYAIYRLARYREMAYAFVLIGIATMLLPSTLSIAFPNENPSVVRAGGAIPFVFILVALPLAWLTRALKQSLTNESIRRLLAGAAIGSIIIIGMWSNYTRYFNDFDESYRRLSWNSSEVAAAIHSYAGVVDLEHTWILLYPHWIDTRNVAINLHAIGWEQTLPAGEQAREQLDDPASKLYVLNPGDVANLTKLREIFPAGQERRFSARTPGHDFLLYYVTGNIPNAPLVSPKR